MYIVYTSGLHLESLSRGGGKTVKVKILGGGADSFTLVCTCIYLCMHLCISALVSTTNILGGGGGGGGGTVARGPPP